MVTSRQIRTITIALHLLWFGLMAAVPVVVVSMLRRIPSELPLPSIVRESPSVEEAVAAVPDLAWYAPIWERDLKQIPIPQPEPQVIESRPNPGPLPSLLATLVQPSGSYAHFAGPDGRAELKGLNEGVGACVLRRIEPFRVELTCGERSVWIELPKRGS